MLHRTLRFAAATLAAFAFAAWSAPADDLREAQKLYSSGKLQPALEKVDGFLRTAPKDPQGRFLRGLILTEQKRTADAIQMFTGLTEDYPELPEPYNNLAVLYASQGNFDKARSALELAIHTHPSYATAYENLGDVYAQLASRSYDKALQLDKSNASAQVKLSMVKNLFSPQRDKLAAGEPAARPEPRRAEPKVEAPKPEPAAPKAEATPAKAPEKAAAPSAKTELAKATAPAVVPAQAGTQSAPVDDRAAIIAAVENWASAWSAKDVRGYLAAYAPDFEVPDGGSRSAWEQQRMERIQKPKSIEVTVKIVSTTIRGGEATVTFRQSYRSDTLKSHNTKTLKLVKSGDRWLIKQERSAG